MISAEISMPEVFGFFLTEVYMLHVGLGYDFFCGKEVRETQSLPVASLEGILKTKG